MSFNVEMCFNRTAYLLRLTELYAYFLFSEECEKTVGRLRGDTLEIPR